MFTSNRQYYFGGMTVEFGCDITDENKIIEIHNLIQSYNELKADKNVWKYDKRYSTISEKLRQLGMKSMVVTTISTIELEMSPVQSNKQYNYKNSTIVFDKDINNRETLNIIKNLIESYDFSVDYIDSYKQLKEVSQKNKSIVEQLKDLGMISFTKQS